MKKAVIFILVKDDRVLMEQRTFSEMYANVLVYPGGNVEEGETEEEAFIREAKEELSITPVSYQKLENAEYISNNNVSVTPFLVLEWEGQVPEIVLDQGNPLVWLTFDEVKESGLERVREIINKVEQLLTDEVS